MAIKTLRVFAEYTSTGFVPMPTAGGIDYGYTLANTFPSTQPSTFQTDDPDIDVTVTAMTDFYVWIRINGTAWNPSYTRNVRVYPDSPDINSVVMNMIIATGPAGVSSYTQIVQTANRLYFNGATTDSVYNAKFAGKTYINELNFGTAPQLATVATSGAYADLSGKPALSTVATSGLYADLSSKPSGTAPLSYNSGTNSFEITQASATTNGYLSSANWTTFNNKYLLPSGGTTAQYLRGDGTLATFPTTLDSTRLIMSGKNTTGATLTKGTVVYINGVSGNTPLFAKAIASGDSTSAQTLGVVEFDINNNQTGVVVLVGSVANLDTSSYTEGVQLYLSGTTAGAFTSTKILAPTHLVYVGIVTRAHPTQGVIEVKIQNGYELDEIHDVQISSPADKHILYYDNATTLWKHSSVTSVLGFTPYNAANPNNYIARTALSASAPLSYNNTTGAFTIAQASGSTNGFLSSTDWTTFNSKQSALTLGNVSEVVSNVLMFPDGGTNKTIGNLTIQVVQASASTNGFLSSANWTTFNNKQNAITLTTTGTSGAATFSSGTLNIPQYASAFSGTTNYIPKFTSSTVIGNSTLQEVSGNLGVGITPSSFSGIVGLQLPSYGALTFNLDGHITSNAYFSSGWKYIGSGGATLYNHSNGSHIWQNAPSGTANNAITWNQAMTLGANGNLLVGTTTDAGYKLYVNGTAYIRPTSGYNVLFQNSGTTLRLNYLNDAGSANVSASYRATDFAFQDGSGSSIFTLASTGAATFSNSVTATSFFAGSGINQASLEGGYLRFYHSAAAQKFIKLSDDSTTIDAIGFSKNSSVATTWFPNGNVGIKTSSPALSLTVQGLYGLPTTSGAQTSGIFRLQDSSSNISLDMGVIQYSGSWIQSINKSNSSSLTLALNPNGGNVGIGTASPSHNLSIKGSNATDMISWTDAINNTGYLGIRGGGVVWMNADNNLVFATSNTERFRVTTGGNILMGTQTDNGERLYVSGSIRATGNITANSDLTLKKNLKLIDNPAEKLMSLNGYSYQWKENDEYQYGVIAQEVEKVMSYAVQTGNNGIKGVAYNQLTPLLIEGFKLHNSEITQLKERVKYLEAKLA